MEKEEDGAQQDPASESDGEDVDKAILEATKEFERYFNVPKLQTESLFRMTSRQKAKPKPNKEESVEDRRQKLREAAEKRMSLLQNASKSQSLW